MKVRRLGQSVTWTWSEALRTWKYHYFAKCYLDVLRTPIFVDFCRLLFEDFRCFSRIFIFSIFFACYFDRFKDAIRFKTRSFHGFSMDPSNFRMKFHEISALAAKRSLDVIRSAPDVKITLFRKVLPGRAQNVIFYFCSVPIEDFRWFSRIFTYFIISARHFERFKEANRFKTRSFLRLVLFNPAWRSSETDLVNFRSSIWPGRCQMRFWLDAQILLAKRTIFGMFGKWGFTFGRR